jgi:hypothetical protein
LSKKCYTILLKSDEALLGYFGARHCRNESCADANHLDICDGMVFTCVDSMVGRVPNGVRLGGRNEKPDNGLATNVGFFVPMKRDSEPDLRDLRR